MACHVGLTPRSLGGSGDPSTWKYQVFMQSNEGFPADDDLLTRRVNEFEGQHRFGGGTDYDCDPHVMDMLGDHDPDLLVMDITMPKLNGVEATQQILAESPEAKIITLSMHGEQQFIEQMLQAGAAGYLLKDSIPEELVSAVETVARGDAAAAISDAPRRLQRRFAIGGQDQFYLEGHIAMALLQEDGGMLVYSSTQHPDEVQRIVAHATNRDAKDIVVICRRMGGAFGGKESQAALIAVVAALAADQTGRPCKLRLDRDDDMIMTGKRHDFVIDYDVGFDDTGRIVGIDFEFATQPLAVRTGTMGRIEGKTGR